MVTMTAQIKWQNKNFQRYGRSGQGQNGVDIYTHTGINSKIAIQCKNTRLAISFGIIKSEAEKAEKFPHEISFLYIATTQPADTKLQNSIWQLSRTYQDKGCFSISLLFWEDIINELSKEPETLFSFYPSFRQSINDEKILLEIKQILPYTGSIDFVKNYGFNKNFFDGNKLTDLYIFWNRCDDPSFAFLDRRLEGIRRNLIEKITHLHHLIGYNYTRSLTYNHLLERHNHDESYIESLIEDLENAADALFTTYCELVRPY